MLLLHLFGHEAQVFSPVTRLILVMAQAEQAESIIAKAVPRVILYRKRNPICLLPPRSQKKSLSLAHSWARIVGAAGDGQAGS